MTRPFVKLYKKSLYIPLKWLEIKARHAFFIIFPSLHPFKRWRIPRSIKKVRTKAIIAPSSITHTLPILVDKPLLKQFYPLKGKVASASLLTLSNGFATQTAIHLDAKGSLLSQFSDLPNSKRAFRHKIFTYRPERTNAKITYFQEGVASFVSYVQTNYYHYLFGVVPKMHLLQQRQIVPSKYYVDYGERYQEECLTALGIPLEKRISAREHPIISAEKLFILSPLNTLVMAPWIVHFLRQTFIKKALKSHRRLYISRSLAHFRRLVNEEELYPFLAEQGFEIIHTETKTFQEQVELFQSATLIVAPHGAGLANLTFCQPGTKVVEILPPRYLRTFYWSLSHVANLRYFVMQGVKDPTTYSSQTTGYDDIRCNLEEVKQLIALALRS